MSPPSCAVAGAPPTASTRSATCCAPTRKSPTGRAFAKLWNTLVDLGEPGQEILSTWIAKEELHALSALSGPRFDRAAVSRRLYRFYTWCADSGIAELHRLATTISTWWPAVETFLRTAITNAKSEG